MGPSGCALRRTLVRCRPVTSRPGTAKQGGVPCCPVVCRQPLVVLQVQRYGRDPHSSLLLPQGVLSGDDLYDLTVTDGDCRLCVTLEPVLNRLVERNTLHVGSRLRHASFSLPLHQGEGPRDPGSASHVESFRMVSVSVCEEEEEEEDEAVDDEDCQQLPWFSFSPEIRPPAGGVVPLLANRSSFLPLWNNQDYIGSVWRSSAHTSEVDTSSAPASGVDPSPALTGGEEEEAVCAAVCPRVTVRELREEFFSGRHGIGGVVKRLLVVRIINRTHLMYFGKPDRKCECPYKVVLEVCDRSATVCVVLWNTVCLDWYRTLRPGHTLALNHYRVKTSYTQQSDIEVSVNSRNPAAQLRLLPESSVPVERRPPSPSYTFCSGEELLEVPHGNLCDVIGLVTFVGRTERIRNKDGQGAELLQYRWLSLEDGTSDRPIMVKLFSTSQPEVHDNLFPMSVVVCTRLKVIRDRCYYLTNSTYTQVYCTGQGHHSEMPYRRLRPVHLFLQWLRSQTDQDVLRRALIGGYFIYPPPPVSMEAHMRDRRVQPCLVKGAELKREVESLCYRERRTLCLQATVTMVMYACRGKEDSCLVWSTNQFPCSPPPSPSSSLSSPLRSSTPICSSPLSSSLVSSRLHSSYPVSSPLLFSSHLSSPLLSPACLPSTLSPPRPSRVSFLKRKHQTASGEQKLKRPLLTSEQENRTAVLWEASMEFLARTEGDEDDEADEENSVFTASISSFFSGIAMETLPLRYSPAHKERLAASAAMQSGDRGRCFKRQGAEFISPIDSYYVLSLRVLSDSVSVDAVFLPLLSPLLPPPPLCHSNTWLSILAHGSFSSHAPPPSPGDLINMAGQLSNQRLLCVLEACHLGGAKTELVLSRAFPL
ncbi:unnamed protein product [Arctogadus glacialis]